VKADEGEDEALQVLDEVVEASQAVGILAAVDVNLKRSKFWVL
jgi:hypothetical protein